MHENKVIVRAERVEDSEDRLAIRTIHEAAFGRRHEADLVEALRAAGVVLVSLVAGIDTRIVGHILFSRMSIETASGSVRAAALAPMAVFPGYRRRGVGARLIR